LHGNPQLATNLAPIAGEGMKGSRENVGLNNTNNITHSENNQALPPATPPGGGCCPPTPADETKPSPCIPGRLECYTVIVDLGAADVLHLPRNIPTESTYSNC